MEEIISKKNIEDKFNKRIKIFLKEEIKKLIIDYFYYLVNLNLLDESVTIDDLIDRINNHLEEIVFFDENHEINKYGKKFKGYTDDGNTPGKKILYIRDKLENKELCFYHELTHLLNITFNVDGSKKSEGIIDNERSGNIFNEVIVQYTAERIYNEKYGITPKDKVYSGEIIRMLPTTEAESSMKNYQMYDYVVSCFLDMIGIKKEELARKQFIYDNHLLDYINEQCNITMSKIAEIDPKAVIPHKFKENFKGTMIDNKIEYHDFKTIEGLIEMFNYIYIADVLLYTQPDVEKRLKNGETIYCKNSTGKKAYGISIEFENKIYNYLVKKFKKCKKILAENKKNLKQR